MLKLGSKGKAVEDLQRMLGGYYSGKIDGDYGPLTEAAVLRFQEIELIDGEFNAHTANKLEEKLERPRTRAELVRRFGEIEYTNNRRGWINITNDFSKKFITTECLPIIGLERIHRYIVPKVVIALREIQLAGLGEEIRQFGAVAYRHVRNDPKKPLSLHCWGIAIDINWQENPYGQKHCNIHPKVVSAFLKQGFRQIRNDPMHFQYYG